MLAEQVGDAAAFRGQPDEQVLGGDVLVAHLGRQPLRVGERRDGPRDSCGADTVLPLADGSVLISFSSSSCTAAGSAPTAVSSGAVTPSPWASSAPSR
ncbi:hypothetical protein GCM10023108_54040 [Saccharopolyspora hordei]